MKFVLVLFIALIIRMVFFLPFDKYSLNDFEFQEVDKIPKIGNSEYNALLNKLEKMNRSNAGKNGYAQSFEHSKRSNEDKKLENEEESDDTNNSEQDSDQKNEDKKSEHEEKSADTNNSEQESDQESEGKSDDEDMYFRDPNATVVDWPYFPPSRREPRRDPLWTNAGLPALNKKECDLFMSNVDTSPPPKRKPSNKACDGYDGVFQIQHYDQGGASGTAFFLFTIGMLAWADQHNYLPWIHIKDDWTKPIWDPIVHTNITEEIKFEMMKGMEIGWARDPSDHRWHKFPGKPYVEEKLYPKKIVLRTTGVWEHYFLPPNDFVPGDKSCRYKPIVMMNDDHIVPGIHANAPWAPRAWRTVEAPYILREDDTWDEWFEPQRKRGAEITERYIRFNPMMERRANCAFPNPEFSLGLHIRHGDKYIERDVIETDTFFKFAEAFVNNGGGAIFVATDSSKVIKQIKNDWPKHVVDHVVHQSSVKGLSSNQTAAFDLGISAHRTNVEALTDVLALSKCTFFLHGLSAMSEAVLYLNPGLVARSINLEDEMYQDYSPEDFLKKIMPLGKTNTK